MLDNRVQDAVVQQAVNDALPPDGHSLVKGSYEEANFRRCRPRRGDLRRRPRVERRGTFSSFIHNRRRVR